MQLSQDGQAHRRQSRWPRLARTRWSQHQPFRVSYRFCKSRFRCAVIQTTRQNLSFGVGRKKYQGTCTARRVIVNLTFIGTLFFCCGESIGQLNAFCVACSQQLLAIARLGCSVLLIFTHIFTKLIERYSLSGIAGIAVYSHSASKRFGWLLPGRPPPSSNSST